MFHDFKELSYTPEYEEFKKAVLDALDDSDPEQLAILERREPRWFDDILKGDIER